MKRALLWATAFLILSGSSSPPHDPFASLISISFSSLELSGARALLLHLLHLSHEHSGHPLHKDGAQDQTDERDTEEPSEGTAAERDAAYAGAVLGSQRSRRRRRCRLHHRRAAAVKRIHREFLHQRQAAGQRQEAGAQDAGSVMSAIRLSNNYICCPCQNLSHVHHEQELKIVKLAEAFARGTVGIAIGGRGLNICVSLFTTHHRTVASYAARTELYSYTVHK
jgi:hypothetical protein